LRPARKLIVITLFLASGCFQTRDDISRSEKLVAETYFDLLKYAMNSAPGDSAAALKTALNTRGISEAQFAEMLSAYANDPAAWRRITSFVLKKLEEADSTSSAKGTPIAPLRKK
jgi:hypothetical protein